MSRPARRVLVTGSRDWPDPAAVRAALDEILATHGPITVVHGACPTGADAHAAEWARDHHKRGVTEEPHPADRDRYGLPAGMIRNAAMIRRGADLCLAFLGPGSRGGAATARLAAEAGIPVRRYTSQGADRG
jgi:hypothetical protein